jgi:phosphonate degradation associated HDIG domain protein
MIDRLAALFRRHGAETYAGEAVTVADHMLQCAALARSEGAPDTLIAAALLHDVGHLTGASGEYSPDDTVDRAHERAGATFLQDHFPAEVVEPIRLHVAAKRYLCATDPSYVARLSPASRHSLLLQGGPMDEAEIADFEQERFHREAVRIRVWDDAGKVTDIEVPAFAAYRSLLNALEAKGDVARRQM